VNASKIIWVLASNALDSIITDYFKANDAASTLSQEITSKISMELQDQLNVGLKAKFGVCAHLLLQSLIITPFLMRRPSFRWRAESRQSFHFFPFRKMSRRLLPTSTYDNSSYLFVLRPRVRPLALSISAFVVKQNCAGLWQTKITIQTPGPEAWSQP
jgi:hypothetical protein